MVRNPEIARRLDRVSECVILAIVVLAPWAFGAVEAWAGFLIAAAVVALTVLGAASGCLSGEGRSGLATPGLALAGLAVLAVAQAAPRAGGATASPPLIRVVGDPAPAVPPPTATIADDREAAISAACWLALAWAFFLSVFRLGSGHRIAAAVAINSAALALFAMIQALTWNGNIYWMRESPQDHAWFAGGPFVCHNHLAAYLNLGLGFAIASLMEPIRREQGGLGLRLGWAYLAAVVAAGVIGSQSRGGTVAMLVALVAIFAVTGRGSILRGLAAIAITTLFLAFLGGGAMTRLATVLDSGTRGYTVRFEVWRAGLRSVLEQPILGAGLGGFATAATPYFDRDWGVLFTHAESEPIQLLVEGGLVGAVVAGAGVVALVVVARRSLHANPDGGDRTLVLGAIFGLLTVAIQSLGDFALHIPAVALTAVASAGLLTKLARGGGSPRQPIPLVSRFADIATVGVALLALAHSRSLARAESALAGSGVPLAGPAATAGEDPTKVALQRMAAALERALLHRPDWSEGHLRLGETRMALYQSEVSEWLQADGEDTDMSDPNWLLTLVHEGRVQVADLVTQEPVVLHLIPAAHSFLEARRANPASASAYVGLAGLHYLLEGIEPPTVLLDRARQLCGADAATLARVAELDVALGNLNQKARLGPDREASRKALERTAEVVP